VLVHRQLEEVAAAGAAAAAGARHRACLVLLGKA